MSNLDINLERLAAAREDIITAINLKGGAGTAGINDGFEDFPTDIANISSGLQIEVPTIISPTDTSTFSVLMGFVYNDTFNFICRGNIDGTTNASITFEFSNITLSDYLTSSSSYINVGYISSYDGKANGTATYGVYRSSSSPTTTVSVYTRLSKNSILNYNRLSFQAYYTSGVTGNFKGIVNIYIHAPKL